MRNSLVLAGILAASLAACRTNPPAPSLAPVAVPAPAPSPAPPAAGQAAGTRVAVAVTADGFVPSRIPAQRGKPITLAITRTTDSTCARDIVFSGQEGKTALPLNQTVEVTYTPRASGEIKFGCAMGMMVRGVLAVE
jgi:hypothetical protein